MKNKQPQIVVIGGIETGKTSTIQQLWEDSLVGYSCEDNIHTFAISEMIEGRDVVNFNVKELPRINYTNHDWVNKEGIRSTLEEADIILYVLTCDEIAIYSRRAYLDNLFNHINLKKNVVFLIAYGMADWILFPEISKNFAIPEDTKVELHALSNILKKVNQINSEFASFTKYDSTFSVSSIIPYSNALQWNIRELKYQIWNGLILNINEQIFDDSIPTIVLAGKTGCGKTSTINALWNTTLATGGVKSCTKFPAVMHIKDTYCGQEVHFNLVDLPGIAESLEANSLYRDFYYKFINKASLLICLTQADRRAYKQDQIFYQDLIAKNILHKNKKVILGVNQADLLFKSAENLDGINLHSIEDNDEVLEYKINDLYDNVFADIFKDFDNVNKSSVIIYSVLQNWHLNHLKTKLYNLIF